MTRYSTLLVVASLLVITGCTKRVMVVNHAYTTQDLQTRVANYSEAEMGVLKRYRFAHGALPTHRSLPAPDDGRYGHFSMDFSPTAVAQAIVEVANAASGCSAQGCPTVHLLDTEFSYFDLTDVGSMTADVNASANIAVEHVGVEARRTIKGQPTRVIGPKCFARVFDRGDRTNECFRRSFSVIIADATLRSMLAALAEEEQRKGSR